MIVVEKPSALKQELLSARHQKRGEESLKVAFVPTMGALHRGHLELIRLAKTKADICVVSIFVNPTQFGEGEDYDRYPKPMKQDIAACESMDVDLLFYPSVQDIYDPTTYIGFKIDELTDHMCGKTRPGHFEGVIQIVNKLFNLIQPDYAVFGQKDFQQFTIIKRMVHEFMHPVKLVMAPIVREFDGLALSSRNRYLSTSERNLAPNLYKALETLKNKVLTERKLLFEDSNVLLKDSGVSIDYFGLFDAKTLQPTEKLTPNTDYVAAGAIYLGTTRLIDNILFRF